MMKRITMMALMAAWAMLPVLAQETGERKDSVKQDSIYCGIPYTYPSFPGGQEAMLQFLKENLLWPDVEADVQGRVIVTFVVETDGSLTDLKVVRGLDPAFDKEALRIVKSMPKWIPGTQNGQPIRVRYSVPVTFKLE
ncbi:MAG: energy transducer TonB [Prevotella sp.]|nr:energy transducer TonB [Prevotella sp.]